MCVVLMLNDTALAMANCDNENLSNQLVVLLLCSHCV